MTEQPRRVRVSADDLIRPEAGASLPVVGSWPGPARSPSPSGGAETDRTRGIALPGTPVDDADDVYARALRRSQLRLALGTVAGFVVVTAALTLLISLVPEIDRFMIAGLPLSWILHAFAFYPIIIVFALLYARGAARNERAYRRLRERG